MTFQDPLFLYLLLLIPLYVAFFIIKKKRQGFSVSVFSDLHRASRASLTQYIPWVRHILIIIIIILYAVVLARPQTSNALQSISKKGIDIVVALDVSTSMNATDLSPNRIEAAKKALKDFMSSRDSDRVGIVVFAGVPFVQSPLTFDYNILTQYVSNISTKSIRQDAFGANGTAIGDAVLSALNHLKDDTDRTKVVILISDGEANVGVDPKIAAYKAKERGVRIYTIGVGKKEGAPIPTRDIFGRKTVARNPDGSVYMASFNAKDLRQIASITGGKFVRVTDLRQFKAVLKDIDGLEKRDIAITKHTIYKDAFISFLFALMIMIVTYAVGELSVRLKERI